MPFTITDDDRDRRRRGVRLAREARSRKLAAERAADPVKLAQAALTVQAAIELGRLSLDDLTPEADR